MPVATLFNRFAKIGIIWELLKVPSSRTAIVEIIFWRSFSILDTGPRMIGYNVPREAVVEPIKMLTSSIKVVSRDDVVESPS